MKSRVGFLAALGIVVASAVTTASPRAMFRIELRDGSEVLAKDRPYHRGSVFVFHLQSNGVLTGLPEEMVARVLTSAPERTEVTERTIVIEGKREGLRPGEVVFLGPTGDGAPSTAPSPSAAPAAEAFPGGVYDPRNPAYGYSSSGSAAPGDLARAVSAEPPTADNPIGPNGYPTTPAGATPQVGPDGQPILFPPGSTGTTPLIIGSNGTPILAPPGAPGSVPPPVGPNGTPVLAKPGTPGSTSPPVGPNGYPAPRPSNSR